MRSSRIDDIDAYIQKQGAVPLEELCRRYAVSMSTLRRDLTELQRRGRIQKVYGGVRSAPAPAEGVGTPPFLTFTTRTDLYTEEKKRICSLAAPLVEEGDVLFIDTGSTTCWMSELLGGLNDITIITGNIDAILRAIPYPNIQLYALPGVLNRANNSFSPASGGRVLADYNISKAFLAATGISQKEDTVSHSDPLENALKRAVVERAPQKYLLADHTKFGREAAHNYGCLSDFDVVVTDERPDEEFAQFFERTGTQLIF